MASGTGSITLTDFETTNYFGNSKIDPITNTLRLCFHSLTFENGFESRIVSNPLKLNGMRRLNDLTRKFGIYFPKLAACVWYGSMVRGNWT
jgi:hypothetical protein